MCPLQRLNDPGFVSDGFQRGHSPGHIFVMPTPCIATSISPASGAFITHGSGAHGLTRPYSFLYAQTCSQLRNSPLLVRYSPQSEPPSLSEITVASLDERELFEFGVVGLKELGQRERHRVDLVEPRLPFRDYKLRRGHLA